MTINYDGYLNKENIQTDQISDSFFFLKENTHEYKVLYKNKNTDLNIDYILKKIKIKILMFTKNFKGMY